MAFFSSCTSHYTRHSRCHESDITGQLREGYSRISLSASDHESRDGFRGPRAAASAARSAREGLQAVERAVEAVLVAGEYARVGVLPDGLERPARRQGADARRVARDPQRVVAERGVVAGAQGPPAGRRVEHRVAAGARLDGTGDGADPADHRRVAQAVADRKSTRLNSSHVSISYAVFC